MAEGLDFDASGTGGAAACELATPEAPQPARRLRRTRNEVLAGLPPRGNWPMPTMASFRDPPGVKKPRASKDYDAYLEVSKALNGYCKGESESQLIADCRVPLKQGQLWRLLNRALETNPATGEINGYWVCKPNWSPSNSEGTAKPGQHLGKLFEQHPDIEARLCAFALGQAVTDIKGDPVPVPSQLTPSRVYRFFTLLCRQKKLSQDGWPYKLDGVELTHVGREAVRRWWAGQLFKKPSQAAWVLLSEDAAALTERDGARLDVEAPYINTFRLFERTQLDENKVDAMFTLEVPMLEGLTTALTTRRLWMLGLVECSCDLTLASSMSYGLRYDVRDVLQLLYRAVRPPERFKLALEHDEFNYRADAAYPHELPAFQQLLFYELCLDSDSAHLAEETRRAIENALGCKVVNGRVGVPEKNHSVERLFSHLAPEWAILPSATGSWHGSPLRRNPEKKAESMHINWRHAAHIADVLMRNRNVEPRQVFGGYSPLQRAQEMLKGGKVVTTQLGVFSEATLYRFLRREEARLTHLRGHLSSPFVINCCYGKYTSFALNTEAIRNLLFGKDDGVDLYVQEDGRFAFAVLRAAPDMTPIPVALMGPRAAHAHTLEMRRLTAQVGKRVRYQFLAKNIDPMLGANIAIARAAKKNSPEAHAAASAVSFMDRAHNGELVYVDLPAEARERLLKEAAEIARREGWTGDEGEQGAEPPPAPKSSAAAPPRATAPSPSEAATAASPAAAPAAAAPGDDLYGWVNRSRP